MSPCSPCTVHLRLHLNSFFAIFILEGKPKFDLWYCLWKWNICRRCDKLKGSIVPQFFYRLNIIELLLILVRGEGFKNCLKWFLSKQIPETSTRNFTWDLGLRPILPRVEVLDPGPMWSHKSRSLGTRIHFRDSLRKSLWWYIWRPESTLRIPLKEL